MTRFLDRFTPARSKKFSTKLSSNSLCQPTLLYRLQCNIYRIHCTNKDVHSSKNIKCSNYCGMAKPTFFPVFHFYFFNFFSKNYIFFQKYFFLLFSIKNFFLQSFHWWFMIIFNVIFTLQSICNVISRILYPFFFTPFCIHLATKIKIFGDRLTAFQSSHVKYINMHLFSRSYLLSFFFLF